MVMKIKMNFHVSAVYFFSMAMVEENALVSVVSRM